MKETPEEKALRKDMTEGQWSKEGFLGNDTRTIEEIIRADAETLQVYSDGRITAAEIGQTMRRLTREGMAGFGEPVDVDGFEITVDEWKGRIPCPFKDRRRVVKRLTTVRRKRDDKSYRWSDLSIHLIEAHGFFQGKGASYRLEPDDIAAFLEL